jgi:signal transduction histidine kinase
VQAAVVLGPLPFYGDGWNGMQGFLAGDALLVLRPPAGWLVFGVLAVGNGLSRHALIPGEELGALYIANVTAVMGLVVYGLSRLRVLVRDLDDARAEVAALAVARERLRFARDLHDLLGFSLSAITLKTELAYRLVTGLPERARRELAEILDIARQALTDVRALASSYRELSLDDEMAAARSILTAADIAVTVRYARDDLPSRIRTVLATVLREGVTTCCATARPRTPTSPSPATGEPCRSRSSTTVSVPPTDPPATASETASATSPPASRHWAAR